MADAAEEVLDALKEFSTRVWGYDEDKATMAARILWQCRTEVATGAALGSVAGAYAGLGVLSMPGWAVGAFGGIVLGTVHCVSLKGIPAAGLHQLLHSSNQTMHTQDLNLLVAQHNGNVRLQQEMDRLVALSLASHG